MGWSSEYHDFASILERLERQAATDNIEPSRHEHRFQVKLQYDEGVDVWPSELRGKADEIERLKQQLNPDNVSVRTFTDMVQVTLTFDFDGGGGGDE